MSRIALDVHAHLAPPIPAQASDVHIGLQQLFQPEALLGWMDEQRIDSAWVSLPPPLYRPQLALDHSREWWLYANDGLARLVRPKLRPLFHLPVEHPALAVEIAERYAGEGAGFSLPAGGANVTCFSDARLAPLWALLDERRSFVFVHPGACCDGRLAPYYLENLLGNPYETAVAIAHLVFGGERHRHRAIRFCFAHGGGAAPMLAGRWQRGYETRRPGVDAAAPAPRELLGTLLVDSVVHDADAMALAARVFGARSILFGSDWPFPMGLPSPHEQLAGVAAELRRAIFSAAALS